MRRLPRVCDERVLVGAETADDAGVLRLSTKQALVQTVDFFTPIVDDPFLYGQIAATNALSDVYAMGGRPLSALNIAGMPEETVPSEVIAEILRGGAVKAREGKCVILGGHSIRNPEPIYGLAVTGLVSPRRMITNAAARPGDWLVLTKPIGTGIITTALKRGIAPGALIQKAVRVMTRLNSPGATLAEAGLVRAGTDITGFGLLGHLASMCRASRVAAEIYFDEVPLIDPCVLELIREECVPGGTRENLDAANEIARWEEIAAEERLILADAQTSGGLLLCVTTRKLPQVLRVLKRERTLCASVVGRISSSSRPTIQIRRTLRR